MNKAVGELFTWSSSVAATCRMRQADLMPYIYRFVKDVRLLSDSILYIGLTRRNFTFFIYERIYRHI